MNRRQDSERLVTSMHRPLPLGVVDDVSILFVVRAETGHLNPVLGVAKNLADAGASVAFASRPRDVSAAVARAGIRARCSVTVPAGYTDSTPHQALEWAKRLADSDRPWFPRYVNVYMTRQIGPLLEALRATIRELEPDVVCLDPHEWHAPIAAELEGVPWIAADTDFVRLAPDDMHFGYLDNMRSADDVLERAARSHGLEIEFRAARAVSPIANIVFATEQLVPQAAGLSLVGPSSLGRPPVDAPELPWDKLREDVPLVYISSGTVHGFSDEMLVDLVRCLDGTPCQVVIASPRPQASLPDWVLTVGFAPQRALLARAALFITHGGANSVVEAAVAGCPQLVIPQAYEQPLQAWLVERAGIGRAWDRFEPERCKRELLALLRPDAPERRRASDLGAVLRTRDGSARLAHLLTEVARTPNERP